MHYLYTCPLCHLQNGSMETGALGLIYVRSQVVAFSNPKSTHVTTREKSMLNMEE